MGSSWGWAALRHADENTRPPVFSASYQIKRLQFWTELSSHSGSSFGKNVGLQTAGDSVPLSSPADSWYAAITLATIQYQRQTLIWKCGGLAPLSDKRHHGTQPVRRSVLHAYYKFCQNPHMPRLWAFKFHRRKLSGVVTPCKL